MQTVRADLISRSEKLHNIIATEFEYVFCWDGGNKWKQPFDLITEDHEMKLVWLINSSVYEIYKKGYNKNMLCCVWNKVTLEDGNKNVFGIVSIEANNSHIFVGTFDTNESTPFENNIYNVDCATGGFITISIQVFRENKAIDSMITDHEKFLENERFSDVTFVFESEEIPAHRQILSMRSDVFAKMFESEMLEKKTGRVDISHIEPGIFKQLLRFIYCGKLDSEDFEELLKLMKAADYYDIKSLIHVCGYRISNQLTTSNAIDVLVTAHQVKVDNMKEECIRFIINNKKELSGTEKYGEMVTSHPELISELFLKH